MVTLPTFPVASSPVTDVFASALTVTLPTFPVPATPVTGTLAIPVTVTLPTPPVASNPVTGTLASAATVTLPTFPVAETPVTLTLAIPVTVTLPTLAQGLRYRFQVGAAFATTNWVIDSAEGDNISGVIADMGTTVAAVLAAAEDQINFVASAEHIGDYVDLYADLDGSQWIVTGVCGVNGGITATDPS
jgi:hypothetical protein